MSLPDGFFHGLYMGMTLTTYFGILVSMLNFQVKKNIWWVKLEQQGSFGVCKDNINRDS